MLGPNFCLDASEEMWDKCVGWTTIQRMSKVNPSEETIRVGPINIRFLLTGHDSNASISVFEFSAPSGQKLAAPSHSNDAYEEVLYGARK